MICYRAPPLLLYPPRPALLLSPSEVGLNFRTAAAPDPERCQRKGGP
jgi:hypothetical protein